MTILQVTHTKSLALTVILAASTGCNLLNTLATAIPDLNIPRKDSPKTCEYYQQRARGVIEYAWEQDWPAFAPMFATKATPEEDEATCRGLIESAGASFAVRPTDDSAASATCFVVWLASDWKQRSAIQRASTMCHEAAHILSQKREGCGYWAANYATVSGRMGYESIGFAISDATFERHGWSPVRIAKRQVKRAASFPEKYRLGRVLSSSCVQSTFRNVRDGLRARAGV